MLKNILNTSIFIGLVLALSSCQKVIDIELGTSPSQIVIEGNLTNQLGQQIIKISQSVPYTDNNVYPAVTGANVMVRDDIGHSWTFTESQPGIYTFGPLKGEAGRTYTLIAKINDAKYTASSTMPEAVKLDSLNTKVYSFFGEESHSIEVSYQDPEDKANQYRYIMKINGHLVKQILVDNDRFTNGKGGPRPLFHHTENDKDKIKIGDEVEIEMQCIDKNIFTYWYTFAAQAQNGPGGGVTPGNPPSNIDNNALGYFSAHTSEIRTIIVN